SLDGRVAIVSPDGSQIDILKDQVGISSSVFYAHFDRERDLWISLDKGIIKVEYSSTLSRWDKQSGLEGNATGAVRHKGEIFVHTSDNHFVLKEDNRFYPLRTEEEQSWSGKSVTLPGGKKTLLLANNGGVFEFKDGKPSIIAGVNNNSTSIIQDKSNPEIFYAGSNEGVTVIRYDAETWTRLRFIEVSPLIRNMVQAADGSLWAGTYGSGYVNIIAPLSSTPVVKVYNDDKYGIPVKYLFETFVYRIGKELIFANGGGVHRWTGEIFEADKRFEDYFLFTESRHINWVGKKGNYIWISGFNTRQTPIARAKIIAEDRWEWEIIPELQRLPEALENFLYVEADGKLWISNSEGLFLYNPIEKFELVPLLPVLIREVVVNDSLLFSQYDGTKSPLPFALNSDQRSVIFRYALPFFESEQANLYQFKLETKGGEDEWSPWTTETKKEYNNLWEGQYVFRVRGRNALGQISEESTISFSIAPPWFRTWWAYLGYILIALLTLFLSIRWNTRRIRKKNKQLEQTVAERTKQIQKQTVELRKEKQKVERAFENVKTLSDIGQKITAQLDTEQLIKEVYANVNELMPAEAFGIGVLNRERQQLEFRGFMEKGKELPFDAETLNDYSSLAVRCYHTQDEIFINDVENEIGNYLEDAELTVRVGEMPQSIIYLPLVVEETSLGVLTVQSFKKNTYGRRDLTLLRTLGSYVSIALANSRMYTNIQKENRRTIDSLRYAQTIQNAVLPPAEELSRIGSEYFVLFRPRDIVSGDFYWAVEVDEAWFVVVADCTGHGVPGAFMSMIGNALLNEIVIERDVREPAEILENLHLELRNALHQEGGANEDGMDVSICRIEGNEVVYSGASQSLIYYDASEGKVKKHRGTRRSIGGRQRGGKAFEQETFLLEKGSIIYLYTDGIIDQNSPDGGRKFGSVKFFELIQSIASLPLNEQGNEIQEALNNHQRSMEQRDDVSVLGIRL
ncbi:MAG: SpoIIE family protein phosphatase, partial [Bacteroidota bacterium]